MGLLENAISGAIGYTISQASQSTKLRDLIDQHLSKGKENQETLSSLIEKYANEHGVHGSNDEFANELHRIAGTYESHYYEEKFGDRRY